MKEELPNVSEHSEEPAEVTRTDVEAGLSYTWWRTVQEILPSKLRNAPASELSGDEKGLYRSAYKILNEMVDAGQVEVTFREEYAEKESDDVIHAKKNRQQFRLVKQKGKKESNNDWVGDFVTET